MQQKGGRGAPRCRAEPSRASRKHPSLPNFSRVKETRKRSLGTRQDQGRLGEGAVSPALSSLVPRRENAAAPSF